MLTAFTGTATPGWSINGLAAYDTGTNTVVLTDGLSSGEAGGVFYQNAIAVDAFSATFDFRVTSTNGRADGIAFVIQRDSSIVVGSAYGGFGAMGLTGYGVELDTFDSGPCDPGNGNHAGVDQLSPCGTNIGVPSPISTSPDLFGLGVGDIADGAWRTATIQFVSGQVSVMITDASGNPITVTNLQGVTLPGFTPGVAYYFGLTGGTGSNGLNSRQEIRNVRLQFGSTHCF
jgi:hypothetical protein